MIIFLFLDLAKNISFPDKHKTKDCIVQEHLEIA